jgi:short-subunit dehydrogenase involved in D-alanine esterification of teichoic acids
MNISGNTVLIAGGASGGYALPEAFPGAGSTVAICGRRKAWLAQARSAHRDLVTRGLRRVERKRSCGAGVLGGDPASRPEHPRQ